MATVLNHALRRFLQTSAQRAVQVEGPSAVSGIHEGGYKVWKKITFFVALPSIVLCAINCVLQHQAHAAHSHQPEFKKYEYLTVRTKRFPWGDGNHSLFQPRQNPLPTGYEESH